MTENEKQTEEKIFESATEVFVEMGMDGARMQDIANKAGINKALLHYYYRTKEKLFSAVFEMIAAKLFRKFAPVLEDGLSLEDKIRFFFREHITFLQENPSLPGFLLNEVNRNPERIWRIINSVDFEGFWQKMYNQHSEEMKHYGITRETMPQLMITMASISVFPFAARGIMQGILKKNGVEFNDFIEKRKDFAAEFVINALRQQAENINRN